VQTHLGHLTRASRAFAKEDPDLIGLGEGKIKRSILHGVKRHGSAPLSKQGGEKLRGGIALLPLGGKKTVARSARQGTCLFKHG
jgi:hypothetical protein